MKKDKTRCSRCGARLTEGDVWCETGRRGPRLLCGACLRAEEER